MPYGTSVSPPENGALANGARETSPRGAYVVFAQRDAATLDERGAAANAQRFFRASLSFAEGAGDDPRREEDARDVLIETDDPTTSGTRRVTARRATPDDHARADAAEAASREAGLRAGGLAELARRCDYVWLVATERADDRAALAIAAILATVLLGPIVVPSGREIFGVRGARLALETSPPGYR